MGLVFGSWTLTTTDSPQLKEVAASTLLWHSLPQMQTPPPKKKNKKKPKTQRLLGVKWYLENVLVVSFNEAESILQGRIISVTHKFW
jgi:hypothetical protein